MKIFKALIYQLYWKFYRRKEDDFDAKSYVWLTFLIYIIFFLGSIVNVCRYFSIIEIRDILDPKIFYSVPFTISGLVIPFLRGKKFEAIKNNEEYDKDGYQYLVWGVYFGLFILWVLTGYMGLKRDGLI